MCVENVYVELYSICGECVYPPDWRVYLKIARPQIQSSIIMNHHVLHWTLRGVWIYTKYRSVQSIHNIIISLSSTFVSLFLSHITKASRQCLARDNMRQCRWHPDKFLIVFCSLKQHVGLTGGVSPSSAVLNSGKVFSTSSYFMFSDRPC